MFVNYLLITDIAQYVQHVSHILKEIKNMYGGHWIYAYINTSNSYYHFITNDVGFIPGINWLPEEHPEHVDSGGEWVGLTSV